MSALHLRHSLSVLIIVVFILNRVRNYMSKPWFAEGLLGREIGADLAPEVTAQINKVIAENDKHTQQVNGTVPTHDKAEAAVSALADTMKSVTVGVKGVNGVGKAAAS
jgi:ABC-type arginine transport system ATPase subunit